MQIIDMPATKEGLKSVYMLDWRVTIPPRPNPDLLKSLNARRSKQSAISRQRQQFITGISVYRLTAEELDLKRAYLEEWHIRISDNEAKGILVDASGTAQRAFGRFRSRG